MIDLRSDTVTKPSPGMREAMAAAPVGDDVYEEDPTVNRLQARSAALFGKEAALFVPSGTMANLTAFLSQTRPGDSIILSEESHPFHYEAANIAMIAGLLPVPVPDRLGKLSASQVLEKINLIDDPHYAHTRLVSIENTTNRGGGACYTVEEVRAVAEVCRGHGLKLHCDGARIFNASIALDVSPQAYGRCCDTLCFCLSKGLGAPAGSMLVGDRETIHRALRFRKMLGGGMRQVGILAAAGLYALEHHVEGLREDHRRARTFRMALEAQGVTFNLPSPTNIVYFEVHNGPAVVAALAEQEVLVLEHDPNLIRAVFHRDIDDNALDRAIEACKRVLR